MFKSKDYLNYVATYHCVVTGEANVHLHHEAVTRQFRGGSKNKFDFGALPLSPRAHIQERHGWGRKKFWAHYDKDPVELAASLVEGYIEEGGKDAELAKKALELITSHK